MNLAPPTEDHTPEEDRYDENPKSSNVASETEALPEGAEQFLAMLEEYTPTIPDALTEYYLTRSGCPEPSVNLVRLISLASQKFVSDIAEEAKWYSTQRIEATARDKREQGFDVKDKRLVLTTEDLASALKEFGVNIKKPTYFADNPSGGPAPGS
ncbi:hypothetical protein CYMTET_45792 [Cymbomonas tetramitiformis]|uniref:Transcription initiation factor TFIID subunit 10 n=2 Tax=Cymbomonas tetramitiformis TaxID=36881 RepID=A0AAE0BXI0_9CHLO|nr:hypothetical protein CYMTET_45792 [Cymbomonas tetramitiformis]